MVPFGKINKRITKKLNWTWWQDVLFLGEVIQDPFHVNGYSVCFWKHQCEGARMKKKRLYLFVYCNSVLYIYTTSRYLVLCIQVIYQLYMYF
jgi:hypothetical protein